MPTENGHFPEKYREIQKEKEKKKEKCMVSDLGPWHGRFV